MITLTYKDILVSVLFLCLIILAIYLIVFIKRLMPLVKKFDKIATDAQEITESAKGSLTDINKIVKEAETSTQKITASVNNVCKLVDGKKNTFNALTSLTNASAAIINLFKK